MSDESAKLGKPRAEFAKPEPADLDRGGARRPRTDETRMLSPLARWLAALEPGPVDRVGELELVPIVAPVLELSKAPKLPLRPLADALRRGRAVARELPSPRVEQLLIENLSASRWVVGLAGEVLGGGKQDRALNDALLLPPGATQAVSVSCVERGRWSAPGGFSSTGARIEARMRTIIQSGQTYLGSAEVLQREVWREVDDSSRRSRVFSHTGSYRAVLAARQRRVRVLRRWVRSWPGQLGLLVLREGRLASCDVFGGPELYVAYREQLLDGVAAELERPLDDRPPADDRLAVDDVAATDPTTRVHELLGLLASTRWRRQGGGTAQLHVAQGAGFFARLNALEGHPVILAVHPLAGDGAVAFASYPPTRAPDGAADGRAAVAGEGPGHDGLDVDRVVADAESRGLLEIREPGAGWRRALAPGRYTIGRSSRCALRLCDPCVSRCHAELIVGEDGTLTVRDLDSSHGTRVAGERVCFAEVNAGQELRLGVATVLHWTPLRR
jgi:hypothetical protein